MTLTHAAFRRLSRSVDVTRHSALLVTVSAAALLIASPAAHARSMNGGSAGFVSAPSVASDTATQAAQQAVIAARKTQDSLARAAKAVQDMQATQAAARAAAAARQTSLTAPVNVTNGLGSGGLLPNMPAGWSGANAPTQSVDGAGQTQVGIRQTTSSAILNWTSFNIGARTTLTFDQQGQANWVALNRIDATTGPSQILGNIKADGQVYVINQSGIIFGGNAQINVGSLIASTAGITDAQFNSAGIYSTQNGAVYVPSFTAAGGKVVVEAGASINTSAPSSVTSGGGFVLLLGSQVENSGSIGTPKGRTLLAAGDDFIIRPGFGTQANTTSTTRGSEVAPVIAVGSSSGSVSNSGLIFAQQGDITLAGRSIAQTGALIATTSVNTRGTIHLLNAASDSHGSITLGAGSLTSVLPELASTETALDSQRDALIAASTIANLARAGSATGAFDNLSLLADRQDQSRVEIVTGGTVTFKGGSYTSAQGGQIAVSAGTRIVTEGGTVLDASGLRNVALAMASNNVSINVQGNELRDSPQNRDSDVLKNNDVWIDVRSLTLVPAGTGGYASDRYYTAGGLLEVGGYLGTTAHTIGEWAAVGGSITLSAPEVIAQSGATFDISGGSLDYAAGWIRSTNLIGSDGRRYSVDHAPADMSFVNFAGGFSRTHNISGKKDDRLTEIWTTVFDRGRTSLRWEDAYTVGRDAGRLILSTPTSVFEGTILADTVSGDRQITKRTAAATDGYKLTQSTVAQNGTLALGQYDGRGLVGGADSDVVFGKIDDITTGRDAQTAPFTERKNTAWFDTRLLNAAKLGGIDIASTRQISIDAPLTLADGGVVSFKAPNIAINSDLVAHSGTVTLGNILSAQLVANQLVQYWALTNPDGSAQVTIGKDAGIDLTGVWADLAATGNAGAASIDGGTLTVATTGGITLAQGGWVDVSSGASRSITGKIKGGRGGDVSLISNDFANLVDAGFYTTPRDAKLILDGAIRGYGFTGGGTLTLNAAQRIVIGQGATVGDLQLDTELFETGFSRYDITGIGGIAIGAGTKLVPVVPIYRMADAQNAEVWLPALTTADAFGQSLTRRVGADITLATTKGDFTLAQGASIAVDPGHSVNIYAYGQTTIDGSITAKGGNILVAGAQLSQGKWRVLGGNGGFSLTRSIWIGDQAVLDVSGYAATVTDSRGRISGSVADGGSIALGGADSAASDAFVIIRPGAVLDASGTSADVDIIDGATATPMLVASNGGSIALNSNSGIYIDGTLRAAAGGTGASGGTLSMNLVSRHYTPSPDNANSPDGIGVVPEALRKLRNITIVQQHEASGLGSGTQAGQAAAGLVFGNATISADQVAQGGFGSLALKTSDLFVFKGDVNLSLPRSLTLAGGVISVADGAPTINVLLAASYVRIDGFVDDQVGLMEYNPGLNGVSGPSTKLNASSFAVTADLLDLAGNVRFGAYGDQGSGSLSYNNPSSPNLPDPSSLVDAAGFGFVSLTSRGDIRFASGSVKAPGDLTLTAAQLYPLSGQASVLIAGLALNGGGRSGDVFDPAMPHTLTIRGNGTVPAVPASAFGTLAFVAATIDQGGVVRAPLGVVAFNDRADGNFTETPQTMSVIFRAGSITSASANGLIMPFGGTSDGVSYQGADGTLYDLGTAQTGTRAHVVTGISVNASSVVGEPGAVLDLSGGGTLTGAGFITGRGGSVDVLTTALVNANPAYANISAKTDQVYAIVPGYASNYAPVIASNGAGDPAIGRQITIPAGVAGLPAGTYTLLPSSYALLPGAFRVELGQSGNRSVAPIAMANGSYLASAMLGVANTNIRDALPTQVILTSDQTVRSYSQYNEMSYADFARSQAAIFGGNRPRLPDDGKILQFNIGASDGVTRSLDFSGRATFDPANDGIAGSLLLTSITRDLAYNVIDITAPGAAPIVGHASISSADISAFHADTLFIGGAYSYEVNSGYGTGPRIALSGGSTVNLLDGAVLRAGQVFVVGPVVNVAGGATIDTRGQSRRGLDSSWGYLFGNVVDEGTGGAGPAILAVANGWLNFLPMIGNAQMTIASGASLLTDGSIVLGAPGALSIGDVNFGARYLTVTQSQINVGDAAAIDAARAAGVLPAGWTLNQTTLNRLLHPSATAGVPALERLTLTAGGAINLFGAVTIDARGQAGSDVQFVLNTPAIYGLGNAGDTAAIVADNFVWNGIRTASFSTSTAKFTYASGAPAAIMAGGAGTGSGALMIQAGTITLGHDKDSRVTDGATLDRIAVGFADVGLVGTSRITGNSDGTLSVGQSKDASGALVGGNLTLTTPLLTGENGSTIDYKAGGVIRLTAPAGASADTSAIADLGGTVSLTGERVFVDTSVALPSGKLTLSGSNGVEIGSRARIDLAGRTLPFFDVNQYSWGGDLVLSSAHGDIVQSAGALIDVSATRNDAGSVTVTADDAAHGRVALDGTLKGAADDGYLGGRIAMRVQSLGDFAALNTRLNDAGFFGARSFTLKQGNLVVSNEVKAHSVSISVDAGGLTVNGTIDASGAKPGSIRLSARDDVTLASSAVLDTHSNVLQTDSYGAPIAANNTAHVDLTTTQGTVRLASGATIDMRSADGAARGKLEINAPRLGASDGRGTGASDIAIDASQPITIDGGASIAVNGFWKYTDAQPDPDDANGQLIDQAYLDGIDTISKAFVTAANANSGLQSRLASLKAYGSAFHLRPGVEIASATPNGNLSTKGDLDLSNYRYGPGADAAIRGSGEAGVISLRAGGNLKINGSINDGFALPPASPDGAIVSEIFSNITLTTDYTAPASGADLAIGTRLPASGSLNFDLPMAGTVVLKFNLATVAYPYDFVATNSVRIKAGAVLTADIIQADGTVIPQGTTVASQLILAAGATFKAGTTNVFLSTLYNPRVIIDSFKAGTPLIFLAASAGTGYTVPTSLTLTAGQKLPAGTFVVSATADTGASRPVWAIAPMLAPGAQSWSMRFVAGADLGSADSRSLLSPASLAAGAGDITLNDPFTVNLKGTGVQSAGVSVVRTGTGDLELLAGGNYQQSSPFGVYTAGTAIDAGGEFNVARGRLADGTVLGVANGRPGKDYEATLNDDRMYYTEHGGDFLLVAQGDIRGNLKAGDSTLIGNWLWRQGGAGLGQATAWGINFGSYAADLGYVSSGVSQFLVLDAFSGMGTLGGGNVTLTAGRDIGNAGQGVVVAVGSTGRVIDGNLLQTGGGTLSVTAGRNVGGGDNQFVGLRGDTTVSTGAFGSLTSGYFGLNGTDPRPLNSLTPYRMDAVAGGSFAPGDGNIDVRTRGDLAMGSIIDPGRVGLGQQTAATSSAGAGQGVTWFTMWTNATAIGTFAAGGDAAPFSDVPSTNYVPPIIRSTAANGSIYLTTNYYNLSMPSAKGEWQLLAADSIIQYYAGSAIGALSASPASIATPFNPGWVLRQISGTSWTIADSNAWTTGNNLADSTNRLAYDFDSSGFQSTFGRTGPGGTLFVFGPNTVTDSSAAGNVTSRIYAVNGDVTGLRYGEIYQSSDFVGSGYVYTNYYRAAKPVDVMAGGDIVNLKGVILHNDPNDVSAIAAGGNIIYAGLKATGDSTAGLMVAGPGTLELTAGKNIYQGSLAGIESIGPLVQGDTRPGAGVVLQAGAGVGVPGVGEFNWNGFAALYLDPANLADKGPLADQPGKVAKTYDQELISWLKQRFGYQGDAPLAYFNTRAAAQQRIFLRQVYYAELTAGGREYNDTTSSRYGSYLRGRAAIATLFPPDAGAYKGDITMFSAKPANSATVTSGFVHTDFGGDIQLLAPAGQVTLGTEGLAPGADAGLITQGTGNIDVYSNGSVLLGLSRVMTTFGGNILMWSASGDINAGRGSKTTVLYTPPRRTYDRYGNVALAPQVPSSGAGIATLNPIPAVPPGDIDLIAPEGTIDAGEAGIRVSGNVNLAALQIVNAANISVQGTSSGIPTVQAPSISAALSSSNATAATQQTATPGQGGGNAQPSVIIVEVLGYGGGNEGDPQRQQEDDARRRRTEQQTYDPNSAFRAVGNGKLTEEQRSRLTEREKDTLDRLVSQAGPR